jgi:hypothetical protein
MQETIMKKMFIACILFLVAFGRFAEPARSALLINEIACGNPGDDWMELYLSDDARTQMDISRLVVSMYTGANEPLSDQPVTLYSYDRRETPYDDRFAVVHPGRPLMHDETDLTGDTNHNGRLDLYCSNSSSGFWNSDGLVAVDEDDDPGNGGIIDFVAYSNRDGSPNTTIQALVEKAAASGHWAGTATENIQQCMIDIGQDGIASHMSIARKTSPDTNSQDDFLITSNQTPGWPNILKSGASRSGEIISIARKKISVIPSHPQLGDGIVDCIVRDSCSVRLRVFTSTGVLVYESPLYRDVNPGRLVLRWEPGTARRRIRTGLYLGLVEATASRGSGTLTEKIFFIVSRYR